MNNSLKFCLKWFFRCTIALVVIGIAAFIWIRVHPPSLGFLDFPIHEALRSLEPRYQVSYENIRLAWPKGRLTPGINITEARFLFNDRTLQARIPSITLKLSLAQLIRGKVEPTEIWLTRPQLDLSSLYHPGMLPETSAKTALWSINNPEFFNGLFALAGHHRDFKRLHASDGRIILPSGSRRIEVELPSVVLSALHVQPEPELILTAAYVFNDQASRVQALIHAPPGQDSDAGKLSESKIHFSNIYPPILADLAPDLGHLKGLDFTADLELLFHVAASGTVDNVRFEIESTREGTLFHPGIWEAPIPVEELAAKGWLKNAFSLLDLASVHLESGETTFDVTGTVDNLGKFDAISLDVRVDDLNPAMAHQFWPDRLVPGTRNWIRDNFLKGEIHDAVAKIRITPEDLAAPVLPSGIIEVTAPFKGVAMTYIEGLDPIEDAEGTARFTAHDIIIDVTSARTYKTRASEGKVVIGNFTAPRTTIDIHATAKGPADDLRKVVDVLTKNTEYSIKIAAGKAETRLSFHWPLAHFSEETFDYQAASTIRGIEVPDFRGFRWDQETLVVSLDRKAIAVNGEGGKISSETQLETAIPIKKFEAVGELSYTPAGIDVSSFSADLDGPVLKFSGRTMAADPFPRILFNGTVDDLPIKTAHQYWPRHLTVSLREWLRTNVLHGRISHAGIHIDLDPAVSSLDKLPNTAVAVEAAFSGVQLDYLPPLSHIHHAKGRFTLSTDAAHIRLDSGQVSQSQITTAHADITGIQTGRLWLDAFAGIQGPASDLLEAANGMLKETLESQGLPPLGEAQASTRIHVGFPLHSNSAATNVDYTIASEITDITVDDYLGLNLKNGKAAAALDNDHFSLDGSIWSGQTPVSVHWENSAEAFGSVQLSAMVDPDNHADFQLPPLPFLKGTVQADIDLTLTTAGTAIESRLDFTHTAINLKQWGWEKPTGIPAVLESREKTIDGKEITVSRLIFSGKNLDVKGAGKITFGDPVALDFQFDRLNVGEHRLSAQVAFDREKGYRVDLKGNRFDATGLLAPQKPPTEASDQKADQKKAPKTDQTAEKKSANSGTLTIDLEQAVLANDVKLEHPKGNIVWNGEKIRSAVIDGQFKKKFPLNITVTQNKDPNKLLIRTEDAGALLKGINLYQNIQGGTLVFNGRCEDFLPTTQPVSGKAEIRDFLLVDAPGLVKVLSMASFVGALSQLKSGGISFSILEGDLAFGNNIMTLENGRMEGISLAMTAEGTYDIENRMSDLKGVVVPINIINKVMDMIPVVGKLIRGDGMIATDYTIKGPYNDPEVSIKPLTTLSVGFLRNLLKGLNIKPTKSDGEAGRTPSSDQLPNPQK